MNLIDALPIDWKIVLLKEICKIIVSNVDKHIFENEIPVKICNYTDVYYNNFIFSELKLSDGTVKSEELQKYSLRKGDVIITKDSEDRKDIAVPALVLEEMENVVCGYHLAILRPFSKKIDSGYLSQMINYAPINHQFQKLANGMTRFGLNICSIENAKIPIPDLNEQQKISEILMGCDLKITIINNLVNELKIRNKNISKNLISGRKRIQGFNNEWKFIPLENCLKNEIRLVEKPKEPFLSIGIRSHGKGIFHKPNFNPADIAMEELYEVKEDDLIVNITFAWEQAIAIVSKEDDGGLVSHRFPTYIFKKEKAIPEFFRHFILQPRFKYLLELISPGGAGRNRVMSKKDFLKLEVKIPSVEEQQAIAEVLDAANLELKLYEEKLRLLQEQKKGLLQQLLTGKTRVILR